MSTVEAKEKAQYQTDIANSPKFKKIIHDLYFTEFNEIIEKIIVKQEGDFMRTLSQRVRRLLSEKYTDDIFEDVSLITLLRVIEADVYHSKYKVIYPIIKKLKNDEKTISTKTLSFWKHCNYQGDNLIHKCSNGELSSSFFSDGEYLLCQRCSYVNRIACAKLYCGFCSVEYFTKIDYNINDKNDENLQPATWEKYHCNIIFNDQMKCIQCSEYLKLNITSNLLVCKKCGLNSDPMDILWRCVICSCEFKSNAKIYNPLEYKMIKRTIKDALISNEYAKPLYFPCGHDHLIKMVKHKSDCEGILYIGDYNETKMIICSKCNIVTVYEKFIWTCPICNKRFRDKATMTHSLISFKDEELVSLNASTNDSVTMIEKMKLTLSLTSRKDSDEILPVIEKKKDNISPLITKINENMTKLVIVENIQKVDINDFIIISEIARGTSRKVYAIKDPDNHFYAMKKQNYDKKLLNSYFLQFSIKFSGIIPIKGISIDDDTNEVAILEELGICDLEKEIISRRRIKRFYSEYELINILYQISFALSYLQTNGYVHWNICTNNIILFNDGKYKLSGFSSSRKISDNNWSKTDNSLVPPINQRNNMFKADTFCLGLTMLYTATFNEHIIEDIMAIDYSKYISANDKIKNILKDHLITERNSVLFMDLIFSMLNANVYKRYDFIDVNKYIIAHFSSESNNNSPINNES